MLHSELAEQEMRAARAKESAENEMRTEGGEEPAAKRSYWKKPQALSAALDTYELFLLQGAVENGWGHNKHQAAMVMAAQVPQVIPGHGQPSVRTINNFLNDAAADADAKLAILQGERTTETGGFSMETKKRGEMALALQAFADYMRGIQAEAALTSAEKKKKIEQEAEKRKREKSFWQQLSRRTGPLTRLP